MGDAADWVRGDWFCDIVGLLDGPCGAIRATGLQGNTPCGSAASDYVDVIEKRENEHGWRRAHWPSHACIKTYLKAASEAQTATKHAIRDWKQNLDRRASCPAGAWQHYKTHLRFDVANSTTAGFEIVLGMPAWHAALARCDGRAKLGGASNPAASTELIQHPAAQLKQHAVSSPETA